MWQLPELRYGSPTASCVYIAARSFFENTVAPSAFK